MLEESVRLVFPGCRCAGLLEWESYAAATLLARMEDESMEPAPVWCGDLRDFDAKPFRGVVDILTAGLPCQPYSLAGKQQGNTDHRSFGDGDGPIPNALRIISECRPAVVFFENVPAWVAGGWFRPVGDELSRMGYEIVEPVFIAANDVGASHQRERVFILADAHQPRLQGRPWERECAGQHASGSGMPEIFAPGPNSPAWPAILATKPHLAPAVEPGFCELASGQSLVVDSCRADELRCVGNQVVALQAAVALVELLRRMKNNPCVRNVI